MPPLKAAALVPPFQYRPSCFPRLMTESADLRNTPGVLECALEADEVWVPTAFHAGVFARAGLNPSRVAVVPEAVDARLFARAAGHPPPPLPAWPRPSAAAAAVPGKGGAVAAAAAAVAAPETFVFLSVFKWERRKGWDLLLDAYWRAFGPSDPVVLRLRAWKPHWERGTPDLDAEIEAYAASKRRMLGGAGAAGAARVRARAELAAVEWVGSAAVPHAEELTRAAVRELYRGAHAFVLPTRGEG